MRTKRAILLLLAFLLSLQLNLAGFEAEEVQPEPGKQSQISAAVEEPAADPGGLAATLKELSGEVEKLRGLEFKLPLQWGIKTVEALEQMLLDELAKDWPDEEIRGTTKVLVKLGVWPQEKDLKETLVKLLSEQVAAFYHPPSKRFYFMGSYQGLYLRMTASHELTHVLQDQHFDLESLPLREKSNSDRVLACEALVEGDATAVMLDYCLGQDSSKNQRAHQAVSRAMSIAGAFVLPEVPMFLRENLFFPYVWGLLFVQEARRRGGWEKVDQIFSDLPASTEQILHLEKYFVQRDVPVSVEIPGLAASLSNWKQIDNDVIGELNLQIIMKSFLTMDEASLASQGWGGDRLLAFENKSGEVMLAIFTTWDTEEDAREFFLAYKQVVVNKYKEEKLIEDTAALVSQWQTEAGAAYLERRGKDVGIIEGAPAALLGKVKAKLWQAKKFQKPPASQSQTRPQQEKAPERVPVEAGK